MNRKPVWDSFHATLSKTVHSHLLLKPGELELLFDAMPDVAFFVKDVQGRYVCVNTTMVRRLGLKLRSQIIGKRADELYPGGLGAAYAKQDKEVLQGAFIRDLLELHLYPNRVQGWCLTCKFPIYVENRVCGLAGISRDLGCIDAMDGHYGQLRWAFAYINEHLAENISMAELARKAGFSMSKLERSFRKVFQLTPQQLIAKLRIQQAMRELQGRKSIAEIGHDCGFTDQSAFARRFKEMVGMSPSDYRAWIGQAEGGIELESTRAATRPEHAPALSAVRQTATAISSIP